MDIALDPFPYTGTTTTVDALLMGVPVVTLCEPGANARHCHNVSASLLSQAYFFLCVRVFVNKREKRSEGRRGVGRGDAHECACACVYALRVCVCGLYTRTHIHKCICIHTRLEKSAYSYTVCTKHTDAHANTHNQTMCAHTYATLISQSSGTCVGWVARADCANRGRVRANSSRPRSEPCS